MSRPASWAFCTAQEVVGLGVERAQPPLQLQLARAALVLGALHLYRFCFVVGCLVVRLLP